MSSHWPVIASCAVGLAVIIAIWRYQRQMQEMQQLQLQQELQEGPLQEGEPVDEGALPYSEQEQQEPAGGVEEEQEDTGGIGAFFAQVAGEVDPESMQKSEEMASKLLAQKAQEEKHKFTPKQQ